MGTRSPPQKGAEPPPQFSAHVYCGQTAGWMKLVLGMVVGLSPGDFVLDGDTPHSQFSAHFYCGQTAACIKMPLGVDVGLSPGDFVLDGEDPVPLPKKGAEPPPQKKKSAHVYCGQTAEWIIMPLGTKVGLSPGDSVLDGDPAPHTNGVESIPNFRPISIVAKRLDASRCHFVWR